jgi:hypothetical protein
MIVAACAVLVGTALVAEGAALAFAFATPTPRVRGLQVAVLFSLGAKAVWGVALVLVALAVQR